MKLKLSQLTNKNDLEYINKDVNNYGQRQYDKLEIEEEKGRRGQHQYNNIKSQNNYLFANNNHFVSGDKSKSFYSSDVENNTLFDPNQILMEDQSNSSNFFSNINNSNSHLFMDESQITESKKEKESHGAYGYSGNNGGLGPDVKNRMNTPTQI